MIFFSKQSYMRLPYILSPCNRSEFTAQSTYIECLRYGERVRKGVLFLKETLINSKLIIEFFSFFKRFH